MALEPSSSSTKKKAMRHTIVFIARQVVLIGLAALAYFGVRGLTEGDVDRANRNAERLLDVERTLSVDIERGLQDALLTNQWLVDIANWIYIWGHWPVVATTLVWLAIARRRDFYQLRNAMFISGAIGLVIYASFAVAPPRLFSIDYVDTVTENSVSYRLLQPPSLVNKYAAVPSLHFGWNLLVGLAWHNAGRSILATGAAVTMPLAMAFAVVATANHWTLDVIACAVVALSGLALERTRLKRLSRPRVDDSEIAGAPVPPVAVDHDQNHNQQSPSHSQRTRARRSRHPRPVTTGQLPEGPRQ
ncbi:MAG: phosphatase PAP2 family protein [Acidimicrobiia bacterium]|nr:phosphatase PAP2 family protein [Acidimicrobiia bacterium]